MIKVGITGTRFGMTEAQDRAVMGILLACDVVELHHGDCVGADAEAHGLFWCKQRIGQGRIVVHPPVDESKRAFCKNADEIRPPKTHFARNRDIVHECDFLIGIPYNEHEESKGGTWYTINYARKHKRWLCIVWPSGRITIENGS